MSDLWRGDGAESDDVESEAYDSVLDDIDEFFQMNRLRSLSHEWSNDSDDLGDSIAVEGETKEPLTDVFDGLDTCFQSLFKRLSTFSSSVEHWKSKSTQTMSVLYALEIFKSEKRDLIRLAYTETLVTIVEVVHRLFDEQLLEKGDTGEISAEIWQPLLEKERTDRVQAYVERFKTDESLRAHIKHVAGGCEDDYCIELLTLLKHELCGDSTVLLAVERDTMESFYSRLTNLTGVALISVPEWFTTPFELGKLDFDEHMWGGTAVSLHYPTRKGESEESFLLQVKRWQAFNHPVIIKLFAACHVGKRFFIHEHIDDDAQITSWDHLYSCLMGLHYLRECGLTHRSITSDVVTSLNNVIVVRGCDIIEFDSEEGKHSFAITFKNLAQEILKSFELHRHALGYLYYLYSELTPESERPEFVTDQEWVILQAMINADAADHLVALRIAQQAHALIKPQEDYSSVFESDQRVGDLDPFVTGKTLRSFFAEMSSHFNCDDSVQKLDLHVYQRLLDLYEQLHNQTCRSLPAELVHQLCAVTKKFYSTTVLKCQESLSESCSQFTQLIGVRTIASRHYSFHHELDRLLTFPELNSSSHLHTWDGAWNRDAYHQNQFISSLIEHTGSLASIPETEEEAMIALFETTKRSGAYSQAGLEALRNCYQRAQSVVGLVVLPDWFIPPYEIELGEYIDYGSFGSVYRGKWFDLDVVIKILHDANSPVQRDAFVQEANIWFMLNHPHIVKLYGACHVGPRPFFVCEWINGGTLPAFLKEKEKEEEASVEEESMPTLLHCWMLVYQTALGLTYLHDRGIVHGDLKGNNILVAVSDIFVVTSESAKLTDFSLSRFQNRHGEQLDEEGGGALGAYRWKAPEVLNGGCATFASDVYSFGMCMVEAFSGAYPWGSENDILDDTAVKTHVMKGTLPQKPPMIKEKVWEIIVSMCCFNPEDRPSMGVVADALRELDIFDDNATN